MNDSREILSRLLLYFFVVGFTGAVAMPGLDGALAQNDDPSSGGSLPPPSATPLSIDLSRDPILGLAETITGDAWFIAMLDQALQLAPEIAEARAGEREADAARREARSALFPTIDVGLNGRSSFARNFSNDADNIIERSRASSRIDATFRLEQRILDFGAASIRTDAAGARLRAAQFETERQVENIVLEAIGTWYDVFAWRNLTEISQTAETDYAEIRSAIEMRIAQGASARGDLARIDQAIASRQAETARFERLRDAAAARFETIYNAPIPTQLGRLETDGRRFASAEAARAAALSGPIVSLVQAQERAALQDARAARAETLPRVTAGVEGGRFGLFEEGDDYDIRGTFSLQHRFFGAADPRADQAEARATAASARARRITEDVLTETAIAWSDIRALAVERNAAERRYVASRQNRDVVFERFRVVSGTLFDVLEAEEALVNAATAYIQSVVELDVARFTLLARTGRLADSFGVDTNAGMATTR